MGISCKPMGKMKSAFQKIENEQMKELQEKKQKTPVKKENKNKN